MCRAIARRGAAGAAGVLALLPGAAQACAVCIDWGREWQGLNPGFYWSAVLLTALPFVVVGAAGAWLGRLARPSARNPGSRAGAGERPPAPPRA